MTTPTLHEKPVLIEKLEALSRLLDTRFRIPGTGIRVGWDALIGMVPAVGDGLSLILSGSLLVYAGFLRLPFWLMLKMVLNLTLDLLLGTVPLVGDVADIFFRANRKNLRLLIRHLKQPE